MMLQNINPIKRSIRIPRPLQSVLKRQMVRISLNPVIYRRSQRIVRWSRDGSGTVSAQSVVLKAAQCYPRLSLSNAVEVVLLDLLLQWDREERESVFSEEEQRALDRFRCLSVGEKIRLTRKRNELARYLRSLPWQRKNEKIS